MAEVDLRVSEAQGLDLADIKWAMHPAGLLHHQLFFHSMELRRPGTVQLRLLETPRDLTRFDERRDANPASPWLIWARFVVPPR